MLDVFAIYSGMTVLASGTPPVLWPNSSFPASGPSAEFLASNSAQKVLNAIAVTRYQKVVSAAPYIAGDGKIYNVQAVALSAQELSDKLAAYKTARSGDVDQAKKNQIDAYMSGIDRARNLGKVLQTLKARLFAQTSALPITWANGQLPIWTATKAVLDWFDDMKTVADNANASIAAITTGTANCLDAVDAIVSGISWPAAP